MTHDYRTLNRFSIPSHLAAIAVVFSLISNTGTFAGNSEPDEGENKSAGKTHSATGFLRFEADHVFFGQDSGVIHLLGSAVLDQEGMHLEADTVQYDSEIEILTARGQPLLKSSGDLVSGEKMEYHVPSKQGKITDGITLFENGLYRGDIIKSLTEDDFRILNGRFSTCRFRESHYYFKSNEINLKKEDKTVARPIILYVADIPVFYLPYFIFSLSSGRHSGLLTPRYSEDSVQGRYLRDVGYYFAPNDYWDLVVKGDIYESGKYRYETDLSYAKRYVIPSGSLRASYQSGPEWGNEDIALNFNHQHKPFQDASLSLSGSFADRNRRSGSAWSFQRDLNGSLSWRQELSEKLSFSASSSFSRDLIEGDRIETFPSVTISRSWQEFLEPQDDTEEDLPFLSKLGFTWSAAWKQYLQNTGSAYRTYKYIDQKVSLSGRSIDIGGGAVNLSPSLTLYELWSRNRYSYEEGSSTGKLDWGLFTRHTWSSQLRMKSSMRGLFTPGWGPFKTALHTIDPSVTMYYTPKFDKYFFYDSVLDREQDLFTGINSTLREKRHVSFSLTNAFKIKWKQAEGEEVKIDLLSLTVSGTYDYLHDYESDLPGEQHLSGINISSRLQPSKKLAVSMSCPYDYYHRERGTFSATTTYKFSGSTETGATDFASLETPENEDSELLPSSREDPFSIFFEEPESGRGKSNWSINGTYRFSRSAMGENSSKLSGSVSFNPTRQWGVGVNFSYDITDKDLTSSSLRITRDMHCWTGSLDYRRSGDVWNYYLLIQVKDLPDLKVEKSAYGY